MVLAPLVLITVLAGDPAHDASAGAVRAGLQSLIGGAQADEAYASTIADGLAAFTRVHRGPTTLAVIATAFACWIVGVGLAFLLVRRSVVYPLSVLLEIVDGGSGERSVQASGRAIPEDFDAIRRAVLAMRESTEAREIALRRTQDHLVHLATSDALTGIGNRRAFDAAFAQCWLDAMGDGSSIALAVFDIDFFKMFNDRHGHLKGDRCLREVAQALQLLRVRDGDLAARLGGDEFALLLHRTDLEGAVTVAQRALSAIRARRIPHPDGRGGIVTASVGVAAYRPRPGVAPLALFAAADAALYSAKAGGRDTLATGVVLARRPTVRLSYA